MSSGREFRSRGAMTTVEICRLVGEFEDSCM